MADMFGQTLAVGTGTRVPTQIDEPGMLIGFDFFMAHRAIISREHEKLYFSYTGCPIIEPPPARPSQLAAPASPTTPPLAFPAPAPPGP